VKVWPAIVIVPDLELVVPLAATENCTEPSPSPFEPEVTEIQDSLLDAVQLHPVCAVTFTELVPPSGPKL
jgi:hypothetical protein